MRIRIAVVCHRYEYRHCWFVSSILQQVGRNLPDIVIDTAVLEGPANPIRFPADMAPNYNGKVSLAYHQTEREVFARRGLVRNEQLARAISAGDEWIWFADCDRVYHPRFVSVLARHLTGRLKLCDKLITYKWRYSTALYKTAAMIIRHKKHPYIPQAFIKASALPIADKRYVLAATGGMQVARVAAVIAKTGGLYVDPKNPHDRHLFEHGQRALSDLYFRKAMGSCAITLPKALHLEHNRDKQVGRHIDEQR